MSFLFALNFCEFWSELLYLMNVSHLLMWQTLSGICELGALWILCPFLLGNSAERQITMRQVPLGLRRVPTHASKSRPSREELGGFVGEHLVRMLRRLLKNFWDWRCSTYCAWQFEKPLMVRSLDLLRLRVVLVARLAYLEQPL